MLFRLVVLLGAGLSLAAGFVLLYVPLTRNVLTFLFLAFAISAAALWVPGCCRVAGTACHSGVAAGSCGRCNPQCPASREARTDSHTVVAERS